MKIEPFGQVELVKRNPLTDIYEADGSIGPYIKQGIRRMPFIPVHSMEYSGVSL